MRELISVLLLCSYPVAAQEIILPPFAVEDEPVSLQATDLAPGRRVILEVERTTQDGARAISRSEFQAGGDGRIDPALTAPISGYEGIDASGPFWSMVPQRQSSAATERGTLSVRILDGKEVLAESRIPLRATSPGVVSEDIGAFPGARLYRPAGPARVPVIVVLGGSEGGTYFGRFLAPKLAARGYAALALPYYNSGWGGSPIVGLPTSFQDIEVERLAEVREWIALRTDLDRRAIGVYGVSKGGEFAMLAASRFPWLKCVIGIVPSDVVWEGWGSASPEGTRSSFAWRGKPIPFTPYKGMAAAFEGLARGERRTLVGPHLDGRRENPKRAAAARIAVENHIGPMLVAGGDADTTWPSGEMTRAIAERRVAVGRPTVSLTFADAGHGLAGTGWGPMAFGGQGADVQKQALAQARTWRETLRFLSDVMPVPSTMVSDP